MAFYLTNPDIGKLVSTSRVQKALETLEHYHVASNAHFNSPSDSLYFKAAGIVAHDRVLNGEPNYGFL